MTLTLPRPRSWRPERLVLIAVLAGAGVASTSAADMHDVELKAKYRISFIGFDLARANLITKIEKGFYAARVGYRTTGIVKVFASATGDISAAGAIDSTHLVPTEFHQATKENSKDSSVTMALAHGSVTASEATPPAPTDPDRVPMKDENRHNVFDPLSSMLIPVGKDGLAGTCNRTIPVFDGWTRFDIALSFKEMKSFDKGAYKGQAVVCAARWVPIAGHIPTRKGTKFMMDNKDIDVTLAPIGDSGYVAPLHIGIQTLHGHVDVEAIEFTVAKDQPSAAN